MDGGLKYKCETIGKKHRRLSLGPKTRKGLVKKELSLMPKA